MEFAVFFSDQFGAGIDFLSALKLSQAIETARLQHHDARVAVVPAATIEGMNRHELLAAWLNEEEN